MPDLLSEMQLLFDRTREQRRGWRYGVFIRLCIIVNIVLAIFSLLFHWLMFREPHPFETAYATFRAFAILAFMGSWICEIVAIGWMMSGGHNKEIAVLCYLWVCVSSVFAIALLFSSRMAKSRRRE